MWHISSPGQVPGEAQPHGPGVVHAQKISVSMLMPWHSFVPVHAPPQTGAVAAPQGVLPGGTQIHAEPGTIAEGPHVPPPPHVPLQNGTVTLSQAWLPSGTHPQ